MYLPSTYQLSAIFYFIIPVQSYCTHSREFTGLKLYLYIYFIYLLFHFLLDPELLFREKIRISNTA